MTVTMEAVETVEAEVALDPEKRYEIVNGQPEEKPMPGGRHGVIAARLIIRLGGYVEAHQLGVVSAEANFQIGKNERIPDVAFVAAERVPAEGAPETAWPIAPDLAVEIISPSDLHEKSGEKVLEYLEAGVRQVWVISPGLRTVTVFRSPTNIRVFAGDDELTCEELLPGFRCALKDIFPPAAQPPR
jgi:Uma2 family endonuclease